MTHPYLPCGYNSWENDGDEVDGPGVNLPIAPVLFDTFIPMKPLIVSGAMLAAFEECADFSAPSANDTVMIPSEFENLVITR